MSAGRGLRIGVVFPQTEIGADPGAIRDYAQAVEAMGYVHLLAYDHVLGVDPERPGGWSGPYTYRHQFHEPFVLFGYLAAVTRRLELATGIVILPQRQTALVAKQAAEVDVLSGGRLRLGVGIGWNAVEYEALGCDFTTRGRRVEEQIALLRALWTRDLVTFRGRWDRVAAAGLNPLPVQRPIPIWMGGDAQAVIARAARLADGWTWRSHVRPGAATEALVARVHAAVAAAGRDPAAFGLEGRLPLARVPRERWGAELETWRALRGVTHLCVDTMGLGVAGADEHVARLREFAAAVGL